jgi:adenylylsulfate kinase
MTARILWFTGLSGSGKTTVAESLKAFLESLNKRVKVFDGDDVRERFHRHLGFSPKDIKENNRLIVKLCEENLDSYDFILVPVISPFIESRNFARQNFSPEFLEIYVHCPLEECISRDVKGLYKKVLKGEIKNFIGVHEEVPYESPLNPEIVLNTCVESVEDSKNKIINLFRINNWL